MPRRWTPSEDVAVKLADALDYEYGGRRLRELAERLGRPRRPSVSGPPGCGRLASRATSPAATNAAVPTVPTLAGR